MNFSKLLNWRHYHGLLCDLVSPCPLKMQLNLSLDSLRTLIKVFRWTVKMFYKYIALGNIKTPASVKICTGGGTDWHVAGMWLTPLWHSPCAHGEWALPASVTCPAPCSLLLSLSLEAVIPSPLATPAPLQLQGLASELHPCPMPAHGLAARGMLLAAAINTWNEIAIYK